MTADRMTPEDVLAEVRPRLRTLADVTNDLLRERLAGAPSQTQRIAQGVVGGELAVEIVVPRPRGDRVLSTEVIGAWKTTFAAVLERAVANLVRGARVPVTQFDRRVFAIQAADGHDAARLLVAHRLFAEAGLAGPVVAMVPHRGIVLGASADDAEGLVLLAKIAAEHGGRAESLTSVAFVRDDAGWLPFTPPEGHPARPAFLALAADSRLRQAEAQRDLLERLWAAEKKSVHAAKLNAIEEKATGDRRTITTWSEGFAVALPQADLVAFIPAAGEGGEPYFVRWDHVDSIVGPVLRDLGLFPRRYLAMSAPTPAQKAALRALAVAV